MIDYEEEARALIKACPGLAREIARIANAEISSKLAVTTTGGLTARQRDLLTFIRRYIGQHGIAPSFDEMKAELGLASKSGVHRMLGGLEERGFISRMADRARAITLRAPA